MVAVHLYTYPSPCACAPGASAPDTELRAGIQASRGPVALPEAGHAGQSRVRRRDVVGSGDPTSERAVTAQTIPLAGAQRSVRLPRLAFHTHIQFSFWRSQRSCNDVEDAQALPLRRLGAYNPHRIRHRKGADAAKIWWRLPMKVLVVTSRPLIGKSIANLVEHCTTGEPTDEPIKTRQSEPSEAIKVVRNWRADLILIDGTMALRPVIPSVWALTDAFPDAHVVVLGTQDDEASIDEVVTAGAAGFVSAEASADVLIRTLRGVLRGELGLPRTAARRAVRQLRSLAQANTSRISADARASLTRREREIFGLVRQGLRSREIAEHLSIAEATVYKHIQNILGKLQVRSRTQAIFLTAPDLDQPLSME